MSAPKPPENDPPTSFGPMDVERAVGRMYRTGQAADEVGTPEGWPVVVHSTLYAPTSRSYDPAPPCDCEGRYEKADECMGYLDNPKPGRPDDCACPCHSVEHHREMRATAAAFAARLTSTLPVRVASDVPTEPAPEARAAAPTVPARPDRARAPFGAVDPDARAVLEAPPSPPTVRLLVRVAATATALGTAAAAWAIYAEAPGVAYVAAVLHAYALIAIASAALVRHVYARRSL